MNFDLNKLRNHFGMHTREAAGFILLLLNMNEGDKFKSRIGEVVKLSDNTFKVNSKKSIEELADLWVEETRNPLTKLFD